MWNLTSQTITSTYTYISDYNRTPRNKIGTHVSMGFIIESPYRIQFPWRISLRCVYLFCSLRSRCNLIRNTTNNMQNPNQHRFRPWYCLSSDIMTDPNLHCVQYVPWTLRDHYCPLSVPYVVCLTSNRGIPVQYIITQRSFIHFPFFLAVRCLFFPKKSIAKPMTRCNSKRTKQRRGQRIENNDREESMDNIVRSADWDRS